MRRDQKMPQRPSSTNPAKNTAIRVPPRATPTPVAILTTRSGSFDPATTPTPSNDDAPAARAATSQSDASQFMKATATSSAYPASAKASAALNTSSLLNARLHLDQTGRFLLGRRRDDPAPYFSLPGKIGSGR
jgi:hypothetical protein